MAIRVAINHKTTYTYDRSVAMFPHIFRLRPAVHSRTPIEAYSFKLTPAERFINWQQDPFGNFQARVVFPEKTTELSIEVEVIARMTVINPFDFFVDEYAETYPFKYDGDLQKELTPYLEIKESGGLLNQWLGSFQQSLDGPSDPEKNFTDLHAWTEVYIPGSGWIGLNPTSGLFAGEGDIPVACTPYYASAAPVVGATDLA